ncbi:hypothetical protein B1690_11335 [Geobacillus sp. 46C-IIa]|uniref:hypothetical protein n=1 Tax=Geobacillus sp. 46C-IIa TaxID=1963025 RepID=UPI0009BFE47B|nr:hypothetical protein [Geobacillus sp. 46C-IIa]OQP06046.1 hypothetical protein B1690_11335 [Geobacillus sp. 46C-IIa]QNU29785.1 hypothetical protein IC803_05170 [Geobacillus sp. 46C-IIa]
MSLFLFDCQCMLANWLIYRFKNGNKGSCFLKIFQYKFIVSILRGDRGRTHLHESKKRFALFLAVLMIIFFFIYMFEEQVLRFLDYKAVNLTMLISLITIIVGDAIYRRT